MVISPGKKSVQVVERPEPALTGPEDVKVEIVSVGICGTDREEAAGGRSRAPDGASQLVIGHEMLGRVAAVGSAVRRVKPGDLAVFTVRRGCGQCLPCQMNRPDMCLTGRYTERGIDGRDGYQCQFAVDTEQYVVRIPPELRETAVLCEPLSVAEKAIDEAVRVQAARLPDAGARPYWLFGRRCLVAGLGPIGLLAALILRLRGAEVWGLDVVDEGTARPSWLRAIGGSYIDGRRSPPPAQASQPMELIFESTGVASLEFKLLDSLARDGVYVLTGIPGGERPIQVEGAELMRRLVLGNQAMVGSVNASRDHFQMAVDDLEEASRRWPGLPAKLITHRFRPEQCAEALFTHDAGEIKAVVEWQQ
jgi:threonine dehydrogenase-like Zn-dependent dehydrogenase